MASARLLVERGPIRAASEDWGEFLFVSLPSPGDRIAADYNGATHYLTVICVHHKPAMVGDSGAAASAAVVTKWTSSD